MHELINNKLRVSNEAVNAQYNYTASEIDLLIKVMAAALAEKEPDKRRSLRLQYSYLINPESASNNQYGVIRKAFIGLIKKPIEIYYKETKQYFISAFIQSATISPASSTIIVDIHPKMLTILADVQAQYTTLQVKSILSLNTRYAKRLYMLACQFVNTGVRYCTLEELRKSFVLGDKYTDLKDFKKRVLDPSIKLISAVTELNISYEQLKQGRAVNSFALLVKLNEDAALFHNLERQRYALRQWGLSDWQIDNICFTLQPSEIHRLCYEYNKIKSTVKSSGAYVAAIFANAGVPMHRKMTSGQTNILDQIKHYEQSDYSGLGAHGHSGQK